MAAAGRPPDDVAHEAEAIAAAWWWDVKGDMALHQRVLLAQELQHRCKAAAGRQALWWDGLSRAGRRGRPEDAARWARALDHAQQALRVYA